MAKKGKEVKTKRKGGRKSIWTPKLENAIVASVENGCSFKEAYEAAGISKDTFFKRLKANSDFSDRIKKAREAQIRIVEDALFKTAAGLIDRIEEVHENIKIGKNKKTPAVLVRTTTRKLAPNVAAQVFYLGNRDPKNWKNIQHSKLSGSLGLEVKAEDIFRAREEAAAKEKNEKQKKEKGKETTDSSGKKKKKS